MWAHRNIFEVRGGGKAIREVWYGEGYHPTPVEVEFRKGHSKDAERSVMLKNNKPLATAVFI